MRGGLSRGRTSTGTTRLLSATALACVFAYVLPSQNVSAQDVGAMLSSEVPDGAQMLLEADTLIYDNNDDTVTASGGVQIDYGGNRLVADAVTYNRRTGRLIAEGNVEIIDRDGNKINSDKFDITDDFADGFVNALRVETVDKTYFAAESGERRGGILTTFNNGVYTACEPCEEKPDKAPVWRIKAKKIIWNSKAKTVRFENAGFEFFGLPLAFVPAFEIPDPTVKRKSGFLIPSISLDEDLGVGISVPYYLALAPTYDLTVTGRGYTKQGFLAEAEFRKRFNNGELSFKVAGIRQTDPGAFKPNSVNAGPAGDPNEWRGMFGSKGDFALNSRWNFGWDVLVQSDKNFSRTYRIDGYDQSVHRSEIYLTGLDDRNYFDARAMRFEVQEDVPDTHPGARDDVQPWVLPSFDYSFTPDSPLAGGELNIDINARAMERDDLDVTLSDMPGFPVERFRGGEGMTGRISGQAEWKRSFITDGGLVVTPLLAFQAESAFVDYSRGSVAAVNSMASNPDINAGTNLRSAYERFMATAGLEFRFPFLFLSENSSHVIEPVAQFYARPDEAYVDTLGIPNEDAQSFVFDAATLFERDKFSGWDRMEGGTRANVGLRYTGTFGTGWMSNALVGQSYHLNGRNSFAAPDLVNVGAYSGLETDRSDFVGLFGIASPYGVAASASARLDEQTLEVRRAELKAGYTSDRISVSAKYAYIQAQPLYGFPNDRQEVSLGASARFNDEWRVFGAGTYDMESSVLVKNSIGFAYDDECFSYMMTYSQAREQASKDVTTSVGFHLAFRTLGDFGSATSDF